MACDPQTLLQDASLFIPLTSEQLALGGVALLAELAASGMPLTQEQLFAVIGPVDGIAYDFFDDYAAGAISTFDGGFGFNAAGTGVGATIIPATQVSGVSQKRLSLSGAQGRYVRPMPWGNDWGRIQIAVLLRLAHTATFTSNLAYFGVCSGMTNPPPSATTDNFIGARTPTDASACVFSAGTRVNLFTINPAYRFVTRRVNTDTDRGSGAGTAGACVSASSGFLSMHFIELSRPTFVGAGSVNYAIGRRMTDATQVEMALEKSSLTQMLQADIVSTNAGSSTVTVIGGGATNTVTPFAFDESTGELNSIVYTWPEVFAMELACIGVRKVY